MDFEWSAEQRLYHDEVLRFAERELNEDVLRRDDDSEFSADAWKRCAAFGLQALPVPREHGGEEADPLTILAAMEALGRGCTDGGLIFSLNAHMWACEIPLVRFGTEDQKRRYLPGLADGSLIGGQAMTEPDSGSDAYSLLAKAVRRGDGYVLSGTKAFVTNAPLADVLVVFASTDPAGGLGSLSAFVVERGTPGLSVGRPLRKMGLRTSPMSEVSLEDVVVPAGQMLGGPGAGMSVFRVAMEWERSCILASAVGAMERQLERCLAHARSRRQFGKPIGSFQAVSHRIVDMKLRLETARLLLYRSGWLRSVGRASDLDASMVKLYLSECFVQSSLDAIQVFGGYGYMEEYEVERDLRDAVGSRLYSGTSEIQRNVIAAHLGL